VSAPPCLQCSLARRGFLRTIAGAVVATLTGTGQAAALPVRFGVASETRGDERRYPLPPSDGATIDDVNEVILARFQGAVYAFNLSCPHQHTALRWLPEQRRFQCPKHKSKYRPDGVFLSGRATRGMDRFKVRRDGQQVVVDLDALVQQDRDPAGWGAAVLRL